MGAAAFFASHVKILAFLLFCIISMPKADVGFGMAVNVCGI